MRQDFGGYRPDLAHVHHLGFGFHAGRCAPGILARLEPVRATGGVVLELGCGTGLLTRHLLDAGHTVIASDASAGMLDLARTYVPEAELRRIVLPDDPLPPADAVVSVGHCMSYLPSEEAIHRALLAAAHALRPGGVLAVDLCNLDWTAARSDDKPFARVEADWAIITRFSTPRPERFDRDITTFLLEDDGSWRRSDEHHENVLIDTSVVPGLLAPTGVVAEVRGSFGDEDLPLGLVAIIGRREH